MPMARTFQTARNSLQATRINAASQLRGIAGGMGLAENNNNTGVEETMAGPLGMWNFPFLTKLKEGGIGQGAAAPGSAGLGVPSGAAHITGVAGTEVRQRQDGMHVY